MSYNGWTNYQTFIVQLIINNDEYVYEVFSKTTSELLESLDNDPYESLALDIENYFEELKPDLESPFYELLDNAFCEINWNEISENFIETYKELKGIA
jgi:hypothetical protein